MTNSLSQFSPLTNQQKKIFSCFFINYNFRKVMDFATNI